MGNILLVGWILFDLLGLLYLAGVIAYFGAQVVVIDLPAEDQGDDVTKDEAD